MSTSVSSAQLTSLPTKGGDARPIESLSKDERGVMSAIAAAADEEHIRRLLTSAEIRMPCGFSAASPPNTKLAQTRWDDDGSPPLPPPPPPPPAPPPPPSPPTTVAMEARQTAPSVGVVDEHPIGLWAGITTLLWTFGFSLIVIALTSFPWKYLVAMGLSLMLAALTSVYALTPCCPAWLEGSTWQKQYVGHTTICFFDESCCGCCNLRRMPCDNCGPSTPLGARALRLRRAFLAASAFAIVASATFFTALDSIPPAHLTAFEPTNPSEWMRGRLLIDWCPESNCLYVADRHCPTRLWTENDAACAARATILKTMDCDGWFMLTNQTGSEIYSGFVMTCGSKGLFSWPVEPFALTNALSGNEAQVSRPSTLGGSAGSGPAILVSFGIIINIVILIAVACDPKQDSLSRSCRLQQDCLLRSCRSQSTVPTISPAPAVAITIDKPPPPEL